MLLFTAVSVAQDAPKANSPATTGAAGSKTEATLTPAAKNRSREHAAATKPDGKKQARALTENEKRGYALGVQVSTDIARQGIEVNPHLLLQEMRDALTGNKLLMTLEDMNATLAGMQKEQREKMALAMKEFAEKNSPRRIRKTARRFWQRISPKTESLHRPVACNTRF